MSLLIVLPSERALLATRRLDDKADNKTVMHALDSDVFHYCCAQTDWSTGIIGRRSAISYYRIASALTEDIPRKPSRNLRKVNRNDVRNSVKRLIRVGLFRNASESVMDKDKKNTLILHRIFWQALLTTNHCASNPDTRQMSGFMNELLSHKPFSNKGFRQNLTDETKSSHATDATYKSSIYRTKARSTKFGLSLTWQYDKNLVDLFLKAAGFSINDIKPVWFGKYVQYWSNEAIQRTQREWSLHFANHMQSYLLRPDYFEKVNGMLGYLDDEKAPKARQRASKRSKPSKTTTVPRFNNGEQLQAWAEERGLPDAPIGASTTEYYQLLCQVVEFVKE